VVSTYQVRRVLAILAFVVLSLVCASSVKAWDQYWSGIAAYTEPGFINGWNYHYANQAYNNPWGSNPYVRIQEHLTNGNWVYTYSAFGSVSICHGRAYTEVGCANMSGSSYSLTCLKQTVQC
jgi:hypothetical protein